MSVQVILAEHSNERYIIGNESIEKVHGDILIGKNNEIKAEKAHDDWYEVTKRSSVTNINDKAILADARKHLEGSRSLKLPIADDTSSLDSRWSAWASSLYKETRKFNTSQEVLHFAQLKIPFDHRTDLAGHKSEYPIFEKLVMEEFPYQPQSDVRLKASDNPLSIPETLYLFQGRLVSNIFYWHLRVMLFCQRNVSKIDNILEVGGGYGSLARLWLLNDIAKINKYVIVDLPESLFFSEVCLRAEFGDQVGYWEGKDPGTRVVLVPVNRIDEYKQASDLVINVGSLQEMSDTWVDFYMAWLDRYKPSFFYSLNYMGSALGNMFESRNFWAPHPSNKWSTRTLTADIPLVKMMCTGRGFVEILYEYAMPLQKFTDWSVFKGCFFSRETYLEGLELLRQDFTINNAMVFLSVVSKNHNENKLPIPKEIFSIASFVSTKTDDKWVKTLVDDLLAMKKIGSY